MKTHRAAGDRRSQTLLLIQHSACHPWLDTVTKEEKTRPHLTPPAFCPMLPSRLPNTASANTESSLCSLQFSPAVETDSSNTLKRKCAKLQVAPGSSHSWLVAGAPLLPRNACSEAASRHRDQRGRDLKQLPHSEIIANNHHVLKEEKAELPTSPETAHCTEHAVPSEATTIW